MFQGSLAAVLAVYWTHYAKDDRFLPPLSLFNGTMAVQFMEVEFNMSARETGVSRSSLSVDHRGGMPWLKCRPPRGDATAPGFQCWLEWRACSPIDRSLGGAQSR